MTTKTKTTPDEKPAEEQQLATGQQAGALATNYEDDGFETVEAGDLSIPFLGVLQALSPQVQGDAVVDGAKPGMLFNTVTEELIDGKTGLEFIPCLVDQCVVEWVPRDRGGGYVARHERDAQVVEDARARASAPNEMATEAGNQLVETKYIYGIGIHPDGRQEPLVLSFASTKITVFRRLMTKLRMFTIQDPAAKGGKRTPSLFEHRLRITSVSQTNKKGSFYNFSVGSAEGDLRSSLIPRDSDLFAEAVALRESIKSGRATAAVESQDGGESAASGDDIPF